ncbi:MAG: type II toxin-antitoxin system VapC family toxin [Elusimicrobiota bacterium]
MKAYLDTSVILRKLLGEPGALKEWGHWDEGCTSELTRVESLRTLDRLRLQGSLDDGEVAEKMELLRDVLETADMIGLDSRVLDRASQSYPTVVGALDAIHLASALLYLEHRKEKLIFMTHDRRLGIAAQALGFETRGLN